MNFLLELVEAEAEDPEVVAVGAMVSISISNKKRQKARQFPH